jgi:4-amino-4-deoxy-L-arabinose transferase-like glycosyltransferase
LLILLVLLPSLFLRIHQLDTLPGVNGDEAYAPVHLMEMLRGNPHSWRTSLGTPFNPLHAGAVTLVNGVAGPSFFVLRIPGLLYGLLSVFFAFLLLRRVLPERVAIASALLISALPLHIAYARISNEPSLVPLVSLLCLYFALRRDKPKATLSLLLAIWVYPPLVFLAPLLAAPFVPALLESVRERRLASVSVDVAIVALVLLACFFMIPETRQARAELLMEQPLERLSDWRGMGEFVYRLGNLFNGVTVYRRLTGHVTGQTLILHNAAFWAIAMPALALGARRMIKVRDRESGLLLAGYGVSLVAYYVATGSGHLLPGFERHASMFTVPACILFALCLDSALAGTRLSRSSPLAATALSILLLISFHDQLFVALRSEPGRPHRAYRTGPEEPKQLALSAIRELRDPDLETIVRVSDWWLYWPIRYLAHDDEQIHVSIHSRPWSSDFPVDYRQRFFDEGESETFLIDWVGGRMHRRFGTSHEYREVQRILGYRDHPILVLLKKSER